MARLIGANAKEAVNWTQDKMRTTRPIAEAMVLSMIADHKAFVGDSGVILFESDEELDRRHLNSKKSFDLKSQKRIRFHAIRKYNKSRHTKPRHILFDWNNANAAAQNMMDVDSLNQMCDDCEEENNNP